MQIMYSRVLNPMTGEEQLVIEIVGGTLEEIEDVRHALQLDQVPVSVQPLVDCEGTWVMRLIK